MTDSAENGLPEFGGSLGTSTPVDSPKPRAENGELSTSLDPALLEQWRAVASGIGGVPLEHPEVPADYVYTANRLVALIDDLTRVLPPGGDHA